MGDVPILDGAAALAEAGLATGAGARNWGSYGEAVTLPDGLPGWRRALLCDPQTSGGLLIAVAAEHAAALLRALHAAGFGQAAAIGTVQPGMPGIDVMGAE